ncbi:uncharacterized protein YaaR (DUF327 family) [Pullulanibacillus pueri]|uniref:DUF327 family protein n=1 Tax=Pullulanibacillus pueri TaxID=1437324 RepID=A0A8J3ERT2_9BACL|nr:YaaR family protein [Pullulanibacillus pueri]MBM7683987.1 uncharacterized protein YaaR (DUF327 family) [Pullulanibacillus pueri]GGH88370.1 hypothetical protein GCM10007096_40550 [Pullulanibacillus pueri]
MKINIDKELRMLQERQGISKPVDQGSNDFRSFVRNQTKGSETAAIFEGLLLRLDEQGKRLARAKTVKDLQVFKRLVQQFVQKAVSHGLELNQSHSWHFGNGQIQTLVRTIDQQMMELTQGVLEGGADSLTILAKIGEIKGLLINLYL